MDVYVHYHSIFFLFLKEVSYALQVCIYLIENTVKTKIVK